MPERDEEATDRISDAYPNGHPWHYLKEGDGAPPLAFETIGTSPEDGRSFRLPRNADKRRGLFRSLLAEQRERLEQDRVCYADLVARGAAVLSRFDREIAYGGNLELARAGTLALKVNHISLAKGRIAWLEQKLEIDRQLSLFD